MIELFFWLQPLMVMKSQLVEIAGYVSQDLLQEFDVILMLTIDVFFFFVCVCVLKSCPSFSGDVGGKQKHCNMCFMNNIATT